MVRARKKPSDLIPVTRNELNRLLSLGCWCGSLDKGEKCEHCDIILSILDRTTIDEIMKQSHEV